MMNVQVYWTMQPIRFSLSIGQRQPNLKGLRPEARSEAYQFNVEAKRGIELPPVMQARQGYSLTLSRDTSDEKRIFTPAGRRSRSIVAMRTFALPADRSLLPYTSDSASDARPVKCRKSIPTARLSYEREG